MRERKRSPKRLIDSRMRGTSAMSTPVPTIIRTILQQTIATVDELTVDHAGFRGELMRFRRLLIVNVQHIVSVCHEPIGNQHAMTAEVHTLGAHEGRMRFFR